MSIQKITDTLNKMSSEKKALIHGRYEEHSQWLANELELIRKLILKSQKPSVASMGSLAVTSNPPLPIEDPLPSSSVAVVTDEAAGQKRKNASASTGFSPMPKKNTSENINRVVVPEAEKRSLGDLNKLRKDQLLEELNKRGIKTFTMKALKNTLVEALQQAIDEESNEPAHGEEHEQSDEEPESESIDVDQDTHEYHKPMEIQHHDDDDAMEPTPAEENSQPEQSEQPVVVLPSKPVRKGSLMTNMRPPEQPVVAPQVKPVRKGSLMAEFRQQVLNPSPEKASSQPATNIASEFEARQQRHRDSIVKKLDSEMSTTTTSESSQPIDETVVEDEEDREEVEVREEEDEDSQDGAEEAVFTTVEPSVAEKSPEPITDTEVVSETVTQQDRPFADRESMASEDDDAWTDVHSPVREAVEEKPVAVVEPVVATNVPSFAAPVVPHQPEVLATVTTSKPFGGSSATSALKQPLSKPPQTKPLATTLPSKPTLTQATKLAPPTASKAPFSSAKTATATTAAVTPAPAPVAKKAGLFNFLKSKTATTTTTATTATATTSSSAKPTKPTETATATATSSSSAKAAQDTFKSPAKPATNAAVKNEMSSPIQITKLAEAMKKVETPKPETAVPESNPDSYDLSDEDDVDSDESGTDDDGEGKPEKRIPDWAKGPLLKEALARQLGAEGNQPMDPDVIFPEVLPCNLEEIFGIKKGFNRAYAKRTSSAKWDHDSLTLIEKRKYRQQMGYR